MFTKVNMIYVDDGRHESAQSERWRRPPRSGERQPSGNYRGMTHPARRRSPEELRFSRGTREDPVGGQSLRSAIGNPATGAKSPAPPFPECPAERRPVKVRSEERRWSTD
jgi:hypothetical protein